MNVALRADRTRLASPRTSVSAPPPVIQMIEMPPRFSQTSPSLKYKVNSRPVSPDTPSAIPTQTRPPAALRLILVLVSTLVALGAAEFVCRAGRLAPPMQAIWLDDEKSPYIRSRNPIRRHELKPGFAADTPAGRVSINSHGFRGPERAHRKPPKVRRIVLLGDSVAEGVNTVADADTLDRQLESLYPPGAVEVLNFGVAGYNTLAAIETLKEQAARFSPDSVVLIFVVNDYIDFTLEHTLSGGVTERPKIVKTLFERSWLFRRLCLQLNLFQFRDELDTASWNKKAVGESNVVQGLDRFTQLAKEHRFAPLIAIWPHFLDDRIADRHFMPASETDLVIETLARARGIPTVRLSKVFSDHWRTVVDASSPREFYTAKADGMHPAKPAIALAVRSLREFIDHPPPSGPPPPPGIALAAEETARSLGGKDYLSAAPMKSRIFEVLHLQGRTAEAEAYLKSLLDQDPADFYALLQLGMLRLDADDPAAAHPLLEQAARIQTDDERVIEYLGLTLFQLDRLAEARPLLEKAARSTSASPLVIEALQEIDGQQPARNR